MGMKENGKIMSNFGANNDIKFTDVCVYMIVYENLRNIYFKLLLNKL